MSDQDQRVSEILSSIGDDFSIPDAAAEANSEPAAEVKEVVEAKPDQVSETVEEPEPKEAIEEATPEAEKVKSPLDKSWEKLFRKDKEMRVKEQSFKGQIDQLTQQVSDMKSMQDKMDAMSEQLRKIESDPLSFVEQKLGSDAFNEHARRALNEGEPSEDYKLKTLETKFTQRLEDEQRAREDLARREELLNEKLTLQENQRIVNDYQRELTRTAQDDKYALANKYCASKDSDLVQEALVLAQKAAVEHNTVLETEAALDLIVEAIQEDIEFHKGFTGTDEQPPAAEEVDNESQGATTVPPNIPAGEQKTTSGIMSRKEQLNAAYEVLGSMGWK